jgi:ferritin-like metal-binding protein YciE
MILEIKELGFQRNLQFRGEEHMNDIDATIESIKQVVDRLNELIEEMKKNLEEKLPEVPC